MRTIKINMTTLRRAVARARENHPDDWQAEMCEIALIPAIAKRWQELNSGKAGLRVVRIDGKQRGNSTPEQNQAIGKRREWAQYAGYRLVLMIFPDGQEYCWNSVRDDWYGHAPCNAWNGMSRETVCRFIESLRMVANGYDADEYLALAKVCVVAPFDLAAAIEGGAVA